MLEYIKEKLPIIISIIVFIALCIVAYNLMFIQESVYYTKIDNTRIENISTIHDIEYEYTLDCYNENGNKKELKFKTSRELREKAYLKLNTMFFRGVINWEEVQYDELPEKVQVIYAK